MKVSVIPLILHMLEAVTLFGISLIFCLFGWHPDEAYSIFSRLDFGGYLFLLEEILFLPTFILFIEENFSILGYFTQLQ